jgi:hypothetical protein
MADVLHDTTVGVFTYIQLGVLSYKWLSGWVMMLISVMLIFLNWEFCTALAEGSLQATEHLPFILKQQFINEMILKLQVGNRLSSY